MGDESLQAMRTVEGSRRRVAALVVTAATLLALSRGMDASAQLPSPFPTTTTAPAGEAPPVSPERPSLLSPPTTAPPTTSAEESPHPPGEGDGTTPPPDSGGMPPELRAMMNSVVRTPANNTRGLLAALAPLEQYGLDATTRAVVGFGRFPVAGEAVWSDDWWFPRFGPGWRLHQGIDIFAPRGTPVRAPVDGTVRVKDGGLGGLSVYVTQPDGTYWYLTHLAGIAEGIAEGVSVTTGQVVGFVGSSGNAAGGQPHLHLQIHPRGGPPIPPKPVIDRFVSDALGLAPQLLDAYAKAHAAGRQAPEAPIAAPAPELLTLTPRMALLWASAASPAGGTLRLVENDALAAAGRIDWDAEAASTLERARAEEQAVLWLRPLIPERLALALGY